MRTTDGQATGRIVLIGSARVPKAMNQEDPGSPSAMLVLPMLIFG